MRFVPRWLRHDTPASQAEAPTGLGFCSVCGKALVYSYQWTQRYYSSTTGDYMEARYYGSMCPSLAMRHAGYNPQYHAGYDIGYYHRGKQEDVVIQRRTTTP